MFRSISIAVAAAAVLAVGALTAVVANAHGSSLSRLATSTTLKGEAKGDAVSALARATSEPKTDVTTAARATDTDVEDSDVDDNADNDEHGDVVSAVAKSDATTAHENGKKKVNHGGAVSEAAEKD
ncbi:MAG: hypothetical protein E6I60_12515 [Chloroflexi bacterium]|nr:MAG: hypothetical protein E6I60_12515 [Chloroflexota bacterium]